MSVVIALVSVLIVVTGIFFHFSFVSTIARSFAILLIFLNNQFLFSLIFLLFFCFQHHWFLFFINFFPFVYFGFILLFIFWVLEVRTWIIDEYFSSFLMNVFCAINFSLSIAVGVSHRFPICCIFLSNHSEYKSGLNPISLTALTLITGGVFNL